MDEIVSEHIRKGTDLYKVGRYASALEEYRKAEELITGGPGDGSIHSLWKLSSLYCEIIDLFKSQKRKIDALDYQKKDCAVREKISVLLPGKSDLLWDLHSNCLSISEKCLEYGTFADALLYYNKAITALGQIKSLRQMNYKSRIPVDMAQAFENLINIGMDMSISAVKPVQKVQFLESFDPFSGLKLDIYLYEKACQLYDNMIDICTELIMGDPLNSEYRELLARLNIRTAHIFSRYTRQYRYVRDDYLLTALKAYKKLLKIQPENMHYINSLMDIYGVLGDLHRKLLQTSRARFFYKKHLEMQEKMGIKDHQSYARLSRVCNTDKSQEESIKYLKKAVKRARKDHKSMSAYWTEIADKHLKAGRGKKAAEAWHNAIDSASKWLEDNPDDYAVVSRCAISHLKMGKHYWKKADIKRSEHHLTESIRLNKTVIKNCRYEDKNQKASAEAYDIMGTINLEAGDLDSAINFYNMAYSINLEKITDHIYCQDDIEYLAESLNKLDYAFIRKNDLSRHIEFYREKAEDLEKLIVSNKQSARLYVNLSLLYSKLGRIHREAGMHEKSADASEKASRTLTGLVLKNNDSFGFTSELSCYMRSYWEIKREKSRPDDNAESYIRAIMGIESLLLIMPPDPLNPHTYAGLEILELLLKEAKDYLMTLKEHHDLRQTIERGSHSLKDHYSNLGDIRKVIELGINFRMLWD